MSKIEMNKDEKEIKNVEQEENAEEEEPLDEETTKNLKNLTIDDTMFSSKNTESKDNKKTGGKANKKKKRGEDFMDYAKSNGIDLKIEYEDTNTNNYRNKENFRENNKGKFQNRNNKNFSGNQTTNYSSNPNSGNQRRVHNMQNEMGATSENTQENSNLNQNQENNFNQNRGNYQNRGNFKNNNQTNYKRNYNQGKFNNTQNQHTCNKFDSFGGTNNHNYSGQSNNQYQQQQQFGQGMNPQMVAYWQQMQQMQNYMQMNPQFYQQMMMNKQMQMGDVNEDNSDQSIFESLEYYFSEENLNKDYYIRSKMDGEGYIEAKELLTFNKMKAKGVTLDRITAVLSSSPSDVVETNSTSEGTLFLRNKNWDAIKDKLVSVDELRQVRMQKKMQNNMNFYGQQANFYGQPMYQQEFMTQQMGYPNMNMGNQYEVYMNQNNSNVQGGTQIQN